MPLASVSCKIDENVSRRLGRICLLFIDAHGFSMTGSPSSILAVAAAELELLVILLSPLLLSKRVYQAPTI